MALPNSQALTFVKRLPNLFAIYDSSRLCPLMLPFMADDVALGKFAEAHWDMLGGYSLILKSWAPMFTTSYQSLPSLIA